MKWSAAVVLLPLALTACGTAMGRHTLPRGYVPTPNGLVHESCGRQIPHGHHVSERGVITAPDGSRETLEPCRFPRLHARTFAPVRQDSGWVLSAGWASPVPVGSLTATYVVPTAPVRGGGLSYFFPGLSVNPILQTVVASHPDGSWTMNSAYCCPVGHPASANPVPVNPGDTIAGTITSVCSGSSCNWTIMSVNITTGDTVTLLADSVTHQFVHTAGGVLEQYYVRSCDQLPESGSITFSGIALTDQNGNPLQPAWGSHYWTVPLDCSWNITSTSGTVTLSWPWTSP